MSGVEENKNIINNGLKSGSIKENCNNLLIFKWKILHFKKLFVEVLRKFFTEKKVINNHKIVSIVLIFVGFVIGVCVSYFGYREYVRNNYDIGRRIGLENNKIKVLLNNDNYLRYRSFKTESYGRGNVDVKLIAGENLVSALVRNNFSRNDINKIIETLSGEVNFQGISDRQVFYVEYDFKTRFELKESPNLKKGRYYKNTNEENYNDVSSPMPMYLVEDRYIKKLSFKKENGNKYIVERNGDGFLLHIEKPKLIIKTHIITGTVTNNLFTDVLMSDIQVSTLYNMLNEYAFLIDFQRDLQKGDKFVFLLDTTKDADGDVIDELIRYSNLSLSRGKYEMFNFHGKYFDRKGQSVQKGLLKTPIDGARLTSRFQLKRKHPILGYTRAHKGVDLAAPTGTPIYAAGDGVVSAIQLNHEAYGKFVSIRHNNEYSTRYAHMSRVAKLHVGSSVKQRQIIGYVGMTGLATGPHLHYEVLRHGVQINPSTMRITSVKKVAKEQMPEFENIVAEIDSLLDIADNNK